MRMIEVPNTGLKKAGTATLANVAIRRELMKFDNIHIIIGERGVGKSNFGIKELYDYLKIKKEMGLIDDINWKKYFKNNFAFTTIDANEKYKSMGEGPDNFLFWDEGSNVAYSAEGMKTKVKMLIKTITKIRRKGIFTIICLPFYEMLKKELLRMTHTLIVIPYRYQLLWAYAFIYVRNKNPLISGDGFGFYDAQKSLSRGQKYDYVMAKRKINYKGEQVTELYPRYIFQKLVRLPSYKMHFRYRTIPGWLEDMYNKEVKDKIMVAEDEDKFVSISEHQKLTKKYEAILWNLYEKDNKTLAQLERLHIDKFGNSLISSQTIRKRLDRIAIMNESSSKAVLDEEI